MVIIEVLSNLSLSIVDFNTHNDVDKLFFLKKSSTQQPAGCHVEFFKITQTAGSEGAVTVTVDADNLTLFIMHGKRCR